MSTKLLESIEVFNILLSFGVYVLIVMYWQNNVTDVSYFLWYMDAFLLSNVGWEYGKKPFMFVKQWRMYSSFKDLYDDVNLLKKYYLKYLSWGKLSIIALLFLLLCNGIRILFCGETAKILMVWSDDVAFYLFFIPSCIFALLFIFSLFVFFYYKNKVKALATNSTKSKVKMTDISDLIGLFVY